MAAPTPTTKTPSPPPSPPPPPPLASPKPINAISPSPPPQNLTTPTTTPTTVKKPQPIPWTHQETVHLIQAYQEKWYSLKRGQLKASQWEEVAVTVAVRCGYDHHYPSKSATQCRHKIEKLRKRYRNERQRVAEGGVCTWHYFDLMDRLERGPMPISARPVSMVPFGAKSGDDFGQRVVKMDEDDDDGEDDWTDINNNNRKTNGEDDEEENEEDEDSYSRSRSINYILRRPAIVNRFPGDRRYNIIEGGGVGGGGRISGSGSGYSGIEKRRGGIEEDDLEEEEGEEMMMMRRRRRRRVVSELAAEIRGFAERYVGMEKVKMEMMRETERYRMEMENKRMEMMVEAQRKIVDTIAMAFASNKKMKFSSNS